MSEEETEVKKIEWEETKEEESGGTLKADCEKLKYDGQYHERMIPWADLRQLSSNNVDDIIKKYANALNNDDIVLVKEFVDPENLKKLRKAADAIVKIRVKKTKVDSSITFSNGTGFLIQCPPIFWKDGIFKKFAVMTNFHVLKQHEHHDTVEPEDIEVSFFYDSEEDPNEHRVTCRVAKITMLRSMNVVGSEASSECLDFVILTIKCPNNKAKKERLEKLEPLFLEETSRVQETPNIRSRLCIIGHPHGAYKHIAFGGLNTDLERLWRQWETNEELHGVEHTVATCGGSSGSPVIRFDIKDNSLSTGTIDLPFFPFLHFQGDSKSGDAISGQSILPKIRELIQANTE